MQQQQVIEPLAIQGAPLYLSFALSKYGTKEIAGTKSNPAIVEFLDSTTVPDSMLVDETAWCSAFVNWCVEQSGMVGTGKANARSWLSWGVAIDKPRLGCVCVFWRGDHDDGSTGHVAFYVADAEGSGIWVCGGNQGNMVSIATYQESKLLGLRWPSARELKAAV